MRFQLALGLALALLAGGCLTGGPVEPAAVVEPEGARSPGSAAVFSVIDPAGGHGEPSFGVAPDGTLFANGDGGRGGGVYRSVDNGTTWERIATPVEPMPNFDPDLAVDVDGNVWFSALWIGCTSVAVSQDLGETFASNPAVCNGPGSDRQYVIPTTGGTAYIYSHQLPSFHQTVAKTTDHGRTWIPLGTSEGANFLLLNGGSGWGGGGFWNRATDSVYFTFTWSTGGVDALFDQGTWAPGFTVSHDGGATWTVGQARSMGGRQLGLGLVVGAADDAGNAYLAWGEADEKDEVGIYMAASQDDGATWTDPIRVDNTTSSKVFPAITAGPAGKVAIGYYESTDQAFPDDSKGTWNVTLAWTTDAFAARPTFEHATLSARPVKEGAICISGTTCQGDREFADYFQVHRLPDGRVGAIFNSLLEREGTTVEVYAATRDAILS